MLSISSLSVAGEITELLGFARKDVNYAYNETFVIAAKNQM
jgi:hypothetical protein